MSFRFIDRQILRLTLEAYFKARTSKEANKARSKFRAFVKPIIEKQGLSDEIAAQCLAFVCRDVSPTDVDILRFSRKLPDDMAFSAFSIMSRATLLLRVATGSTARLFQEADHSIESYRFWWEKFGVARGLWHETIEAEEIRDLWSDIQESLDDIEVFQELHSKSDQTLFRLGQEIPKAVATLGTCERVALWSMSP